MLMLAYSNLHRRAELTDLLVKDVRILPTGLLVAMLTSKTDLSAKGAIEFIADQRRHPLGRPREGLVRGAQGARRRHPGTARLLGPGRHRAAHEPKARHPAGRSDEGRRGQRACQRLASRAGVPYVDGKKGQARSLRPARTPT
ncbi:hypothetical protein ACPCK8_33375 [Streptomyces cellulosae]